MNDIDHYARRRQIELAQQVRGRTKIYLDTRFWIYVRDAALGTGAQPLISELLSLLRDGVARQLLVCPISESTFVEVLKQVPTPERRQATAAIIDELSQGLSLISEQVRIGTELAHFFYGKTNASLYDLQELVWTKLSYTLGYMHPVHDGQNPATQFAIQTGFFDTMWSMPLARIVSQLPAAPHQEQSEFQDLAAQVDEDNKMHRANLVSYRQTYRDEVVGVLDVAQDMLLDVLDGLAEKAGKPGLARGSPEQAKSLKSAREDCIAALETGAGQSILRTIHAHASLHAGLRWDGRTRFEGNHLYDFSHAAGAVSYCDVFLTEGYLANLINGGNVRLNTFNPCHTTNDVKTAVALIKDCLLAAAGPG